MKELLESSVFIGVMISLSSYGVGIWLRKKTGLSFINPLLISIILVIAFLLISGISYQTYAKGADIISFLLTPATICLAVPLYRKLDVLRRRTDFGYEFGVRRPDGRYAALALLRAEA